VRITWRLVGIAGKGGDEVAFSEVIDYGECGHIYGEIGFFIAIYGVENTHSTTISVREAHRVLPTAR
jgi:hypothetical protein